MEEETKINYTKAKIINNCQRVKVHTCKSGLLTIQFLYFYHSIENSSFSLLYDPLPTLGLRLKMQKRRKKKSEKKNEYNIKLKDLKHDETIKLTRKIFIYEVFYRPI